MGKGCGLVLSWPASPVGQMEGEEEGTGREGCVSWYSNIQGGEKVGLQLFLWKIVQ